MCLTFGELPGENVKDALKLHCRSVEVFPVNYWANAVRSLPYLLSRKSITLSMFHSSEMADAVKRKVGEGKYNIVFAYSSSMAPYAMDIEGLPRGDGLYRRRLGEMARLLQEGDVAQELGVPPGGQLPQGV